MKNRMIINSFLVSCAILSMTSVSSASEFREEKIFPDKVLEATNNFSGEILEQEDVIIDGEVGEIFLSVI